MTFTEAENAYLASQRLGRRPHRPRRQAPGHAGLVFETDDAAREQIRQGVQQWTSAWRTVTTSTSPSSRTCCPSWRGLPGGGQPRAPQARTASSSPMFSVRYSIQWVSRTPGARQSAMPCPCTRRPAPGPHGQADPGRTVGVLGRGWSMKPPGADPVMTPRDHGAGGSAGHHPRGIPKSRPQWSLQAPGTTRRAPGPGYGMCARHAGAPGVRTGRQADAPACAVRCGKAQPEHAVLCTSGVSSMPPTASA
jgi:hypothetical protein